MGFPAGDVSTYQQTFDERHRTVGVMARGVDVFAGVKFKGFMYAITDTSKYVGTIKWQPGVTQQGVTMGSLSGALTSVKAQDPNVDHSAEFGGTLSGSPDTVNFLYNPSSISVSYQANPNILPNATLDPSQLGQPTGNNGPTISFDILFDRTYEVIDGSLLGVLTDILALERLCGINANSPVMALSPVVIGFASPQQFIFKALLTGMEVQYTHFSQYMVPMRCGVSITAQRISSQVNATQDQVDAYNQQNPQSKVPNVPKPAGTSTGDSTTTTGTTSPARGNAPAGSPAANYMNNLQQPR